jgi:hypothetical protein
MTIGKKAAVYTDGKRRWTFGGNTSPWMVISINHYGGGLAVRESRHRSEQAAEKAVAKYREEFRRVNGDGAYGTEYVVVARLPEGLCGDKT